MASFNGVSLIIFFPFLLQFFIFCFVLSKADMVPAMYVFGDSLVDVGNNNYINSILKADYPFNGIDYLGRKSTGRFSNGKNAADFLAEKVGLPTAPPYLHNVNDLFLKGVSFASGGAGIFNITNDGHLRRALSLTRQVELFESKVHQRLVTTMASDSAHQHLSNSLFLIVIGSNDLFGYFNSGSMVTTKSLQMYVDDMVSQLQLHLKWLYRLGARKFLIVGVPAIGCCPTQRLKTQTDECNEETNLWANKYNQQLKIMLGHLKSTLGDINYSYFDTYDALFNLIHNASNYGFTETKAACCGLGRLKAKVPCTPISQYCSNRTNHLFWDFYHPTEAATRILVDFIFSGSREYVSPMNLKQLIAL